MHPCRDKLVCLLCAQRGLRVADTSRFPLRALDIGFQFHRLGPKRQRTCFISISFAKVYPTVSRYILVHTSHCATPLVCLKYTPTFLDRFTHLSLTTICLTFSFQLCAVSRPQCVNLVCASRVQLCIHDQKINS